MGMPWMGLRLVNGAVFSVPVTRLGETTGISSHSAGTCAPISSPPKSFFFLAHHFLNASYSSWRKETRTPNKGEGGERTKRGQNIYCIPVAGFCGCAQPHLEPPGWPYESAGLGLFGSLLQLAHLIWGEQGSMTKVLYVGIYHLSFLWVTVCRRDCYML